MYCDMGNISLTVLNTGIGTRKVKEGIPGQGTESERSSHAA